jgi:hypothetical protein
MIVGFVGFIGSGKDTAANFLVEQYGFRQDSFASSLKDSVAAIFGWDRTLLEGKTIESRTWRDQVDTWWANRLKIPHLTPRWVLQHWGTNVCRLNFHEDIWISSLENRIRNTTYNIVISDVRFLNEIAAIRNVGGKIIRIKRGPEPEWYQDAINMNAGNQNMSWLISKTRMEKLGIHVSETGWVGGHTDAVIENNGSIDDLYESVRSQVIDLLASTVS